MRSRRTKRQARRDGQQDDAADWLRRQLIAKRLCPPTSTITIGVNSASRYHAEVIRSFGEKQTEKLFFRESSKALPKQLQRTALRKLVQIDAAEGLEDLRTPPVNRLELLRGQRRGQRSVRINDQWRICFIWKSGDAHSVEIVDYHRG